MLFLTTGTHEPFDRLVKAIDDWAYRRSDVEVFGQIAVRDGRTYLPRNFPWVRSLTAIEYRQQVEKSYLLVAHAGMGSIIAAMTACRPIVLLPRRGHLNETRNDHQFATAMKLRSKRGIHVAMDETELHQKLDEAWQLRLVSEDVSRIAPFADDGLIRALEELIHFDQPGGSGQEKPGSGLTNKQQRGFGSQLAGVGKR